jgi:hypothetical protein
MTNLYKQPKCPHYGGVSSMTPTLCCYHFHSGRERLLFENREAMTKHKTEFCYGDHSACLYYQERVGRDVWWENVWVVIVRYQGRDYWRRSIDLQDVGEVVQLAIKNRLDEKLQEEAPFNVEVTVRFLHSSDPKFKEELEELKFSGKEIIDPVE